MYDIATVYVEQKCVYLICVSLPDQVPQTEAHHGFEVAAYAQNNTHQFRSMTLL